jgi:hypothetical protein
MSQLRSTTVTDVSVRINTTDCRLTKRGKKMTRNNLERRVLKLFSERSQFRNW